MQLHAVPPGDMTESSLAGSRDELVLLFFVLFIDGCLALRLRVTVRKGKTKLRMQSTVPPNFDYFPIVLRVVPGDLEVLGPSCINCFRRTLVQALHKASLIDR